MTLAPFIEAHLAASARLSAITDGRNQVVDATAFAEAEDAKERTEQALAEAIFAATGVEFDKLREVLAA